MSEHTSHPLDAQAHMAVGRYNGIDLFRLLGAFFVMLLHANYGKGMDPVYQENIRLATRWAVPFFFMTTGFFLSKKLQKHEGFDFHTIQSNVSNLITILCVASFIYLPIDIMSETYPTTVKYAISGTFYHLWFVGSMVFGYIFLWYIHFVGLKKYLPYICGAILAFCIFTDSYDQFAGLKLDFELGRFLLCIPYMYMGMWIAEHEFTNAQLPYVIGALLLGIAMEYREADMFYELFGYDRSLHQMLIGTVFIVVPLFIISTRIRLRDYRPVRWGRKYSLFIYLYHPVLYYYYTDLILDLPDTWVKELFWPLRVISPVLGFFLLVSLAVLLDNYARPVFNILNGKILQRKPHHI